MPSVDSAFLFDRWRIRLRPREGQAHRTVRARTGPPFLWVQDTFHCPTEVRPAGASGPPLLDPVRSFPLCHSAQGTALERGQPCFFPEWTKGNFLPLPFFPCHSQLSVLPSALFHALLPSSRHCLSPTIILLLSCRAHHTLRIFFSEAQTLGGLHSAALQPKRLCRQSLPCGRFPECPS